MERRGLTNHEALSIADITHVAAWGWDYARLVKELIDLRFECIEGLTPECQPDPAEWIAICRDYPDTWRLLTAGPAQIVGYWHALPFTEPAFQLAKAGKVLSGMITRDMLCFIDTPGWYDFYIATLAIKREYRRLFAGMLLVRSLLDTWTLLARRGVLLHHLCANFFTSDGRMLNDGMGLGLHYVKEHEVSGSIYVGDFASIIEEQLALHRENAPPQLRELRGIYRSRQREFAGARIGPDL